MLNKCKDGNDRVGFHRDRETSWAPGLGFATSAFGVERDFQIKNEASGKVETSLHKNGQVLYLAAPMNAENLHGVPKRKKVNECRVSLTFREIV
eukprot:SAG31_NODE_992_length_10517_cov_6.577942_6_plen_94_part_00